jgi:hypothetical protein
MTTDKNSKNKPYRQYNPVIIHRLKEKYGLTPQFIGESLRGKRVSETSKRICEDYAVMEKEIIIAVSKV